MSALTSSVQESQHDIAARRAKGEFVRGVSAVRNWIGDEPFPAEPHRYHLYIAFNCPWCHRVALARGMLGLEDSISMDVCFPNRTGDDDPCGPNLWQFNPTAIASSTGQPLKECTSDTGTGKGMRLVIEVYRSAGVDTEKSVPVLYDKLTQRVVSNESAEIIRMFDDHAEALGGVRERWASLSLYPKSTGSLTRFNPGAFPDYKTDKTDKTDKTATASRLCELIDEWNLLIYTTINNGAYKAGFSSIQSVYEDAFDQYFSTLNKLNIMMGLNSTGPFLFGSSPTECDLRLFPTVYRHDPVYYTRMKLNGRFIHQYPKLWAWVCAMYRYPGVKENCALTHCMQGYFGRTGTCTVPRGPIFPYRYPEAYEHPEIGLEMT
eukprot:GHVN01099210.1.p1 GENE.GHVN01099210.1~~GHVN01099210.1.p1  ORF type:complete len:377 (-),score=57.26 GHVN01099210.1:297-1427(-)